MKICVGKRQIYGFYSHNWRGASFLNNLLRVGYTIMGWLGTLQFRIKRLAPDVAACESDPERAGANIRIMFMIMMKAEHGD